jgi:hypothetical protein
MTLRVCTRLSLSVLAAVGVVVVGCHKGARAHGNPDVARADKDTIGVVAPVTDPSVVALFKDTAVVRVSSAEGRTFKLTTTAQRETLRATLRRERELWNAAKPRGYRFLLRVACFCPGNQGWLVMDVRINEPLRAWDRTGKSAALTDWNTFSIDGLYDNLERSAEINGQVQIVFDPRWHVPSYVHGIALPGPDAWWTIEVRALRPI